MTGCVVVTPARAPPGVSIINTDGASHVREGAGARVFVQAVLAVVRSVTVVRHEQVEVAVAVVVAPGKPLPALAVVHAGGGRDVRQRAAVVVEQQVGALGHDDVEVEVPLSSNICKSTTQQYEHPDD